MSPEFSANWSWLWAQTSGSLCFQSEPGLRAVWFCPSLIELGLQCYPLHLSSHLPIVLLSPFVAFPTCFCETAFPKHYGNVLPSSLPQKVLTALDKAALRECVFSATAVLCVGLMETPPQGSPWGGVHMFLSYHLGPMLEVLLFVIDWAPFLTVATGKLTAQSWPTSNRLQTPDLFCLLPSLLPALFCLSHSYFPSTVCPLFKHLF